jgi:ATP-dependent protease ClpP protease subunit
MSNNSTNKDNDIELYNIHNNQISLKHREIYLHSYFSDCEDECGVDYRSAVTFEKNIRYLNSLSIEPILVHMHLPGGVWGDCMGIYDTIKASKSKIIIVAYSSVESASSVILQAADLRILMPNTNVLIHYGSISVDNEHKAALSWVQWSEKESEKMIDIFTEKYSTSDIAKTKRLKKMMAKKHIISQLANKCDWILTAYEAVGYNFADGVLGSKKYPDIDSLKNIIKKK